MNLQQSTTQVSDGSDKHYQQLLFTTALTHTTNIITDFIRFHNIRVVHIISVLF